MSAENLSVMSEIDSAFSEVAAPAQPKPGRMRLGEMLVRQGRLSARDLEQVLAAQREMGGLIGRVMIRLGLLTELDVVSSLAEQLSLPLVRAESFPAEPLFVDGLRPDYLITHLVLPMSVDERTLTVVMAEPNDPLLVKALRLASGRDIATAIGLESELSSAVEARYRDPDAREDELEEGAGSPFGDGDSEFVEHLKDLASEAPVIRLVNQMIARVIDLRASDIHIEPGEEGVQVRYRVDGVLHLSETLEPGLAPAITSRIKLLAHLNIAERRLPQDGRIKSRVKGRELDLRVSTLPTVHGESVVMRVLDRSSIRLELEQMGFAEDTLRRFRELVVRPHGIVLVTGPTGSGKTTTLYAALGKLDTDTQKIITVEDPVEYQLAGINQVQTHAQIGLSFANALRSILRQDPDVIMIGEMRDGETAQIAVQSSLTGHLVLSTLHTNTAAGAVIRLADMGVERYLITSTLNGVLSQRLIRRLCPHCCDDVALAPELASKAGFSPQTVVAPQRIRRAVGCEACGGSGYLGRSAIHELLVVDEALHQAILEGADARALHERARARGMLTLRDDGLRKVAAGVTSLEEVLRVTEDQSHG